MEFLPRKQSAPLIKSLSMIVLGFQNIFYITFGELFKLGKSDIIHSLIS